MTQGSIETKTISKLYIAVLGGEVIATPKVATSFDNAKEIFEGLVIKRIKDIEKTIKVIKSSISEGKKQLKEFAKLEKDENKMHESAEIILAELKENLKTASKRQLFWSVDLNDIMYFEVARSNG